MITTLVTCLIAARSDQMVVGTTYSDTREVVLLHEHAGPDLST